LQQTSTHSLAQRVPLQGATEYFVEAATAVRENKQRYEQAEIAANAKPRIMARDMSYYYPLARSEH
jgi:hypothetical protein